MAASRILATCVPLQAAPVVRRGHGTAAGPPGVVVLFVLQRGAALVAALSLSCPLSARAVDGVGTPRLAGWNRTTGGCGRASEAGSGLWALGCTQRAAGVDACRDKLPAARLQGSGSVE